MARRATLDRGVPTDADDEALLADSAPTRARRPAARPRRGAGGRWLIYAARAVVWIVLLLIGYRGVTAIITGRTASSPPAPSAASSGPAFPTTLAEAYALQFGSVYLNFSPGTAARRASLLATFLPAGASAQLGWNGAGTQSLDSEQVASVRVQDAHTAVITLLALINKTQLIELGVPVYTSGAQIVVTGEPALLPPPARAVPPQNVAGSTDPAAGAALEAQLPAFFRAYASGQDTLNRFLMPGAQVTGLGGAFTLGSVESVTAPFGGATRDITVMVIWHANSTAAGTSLPATAAAPASLEMTYRMVVVRQGTNWYVQSIGTSALAPGPP